MSKNTAAVVFTPSGLRGEFALGTPVLQAAQLLGVDLESSCGGRGICSRCIVTPSMGEFPKHHIHSRSENLSPPSSIEQANKKLDLSLGQRLSCSSLIQGDLVIDVPVSSQLHKQHIAKEATPLEMVIDPNVKLTTLCLAEPDIEDPSSDLRKIQDQLSAEHAVTVSYCELSVIQQLQPALIKGKRQITVALYLDQVLANQPQSAQIIGIWPGVKMGLYGLAIDLGSTTIAAHLCELSSGKVVASCAKMNPQIRFGEDLMSRVSYVMMNPGGDSQMCQVVREAIATLATEAAKKAKIDRADIIDMTLVCNPIMHHLLLGIDPTPLGTAPFALATDLALNLKSAELDITLHPNARVFILPCLAGHIGADTAGMILAQRPDQNEEVTLLVDIGTNAEIVLGNKQRLLAASSPTGPAFEGAQISGGQRAGVGAIERVRIDVNTLEPRFKVIGCEFWSDDAEFAKASKRINISGICGSGIIEIIGELFLAGVINADGVIEAQKAQISPRVVAQGRTFSYLLLDGPKPLMITQNDVRAIQLAKAALYAGIRLLMDHMQVTKLGRISLAGGFGSHIDVKYAMLLGLIPDCDLDLVAPVGNAAGTGARIALLNRHKRAKISTLLRQVEKIETATQAKFQDHFVAAMALPHLTDEFAELGKVMQLPVRAPVTTSSRGARGASRRRARNNKAPS
ncbi:MAG: DUF4445 domain-containing protein [Oceanospirillaceae bacterium]|nr:DUF4445 domain-containing protein [Oceanospirillaceae bacterium]